MAINAFRYIVASLFKVNTTKVTPKTPMSNVRLLQLGQHILHPARLHSL
jgi:hypothetical protein